MTLSHTWRGQALYFDVQSGSTYPVEAVIEPEGITIRYQGTQRFTAYDEVKSIPAGKSFVRIELPRSGGSVLTIHSPEAVNALVGNKQLRIGVWGEVTQNRRLLYATGAVLTGIIFLFTIGIPLIVNTTVALVPTSVDRELGEHVLATMEEENELDAQAHVVLAQCARAVEEFTAAQDSFTVLLVEDSTIVNAVALPGGIILLYRGLLNLLEDESELFALLGHEAGHIVERHGMRSMTRQILFSVVIAFFFSQASELADFYISNSSMLLNLSYDRDQELRADQFGLHAIHRAGVDPNGMVALFKKLQQANGDEPLGLAFLSTHPNLDERIALLKDHIATLSPVQRKRRLTDEDWKILTNSDTTKNK